MFSNNEVFILLESDFIIKIAEKLKKYDLKICTAESCTGGLLAHYFTSISGSSEYFQSGFVTYSNTSKMDILGVLKSTIETYGAVSKKTAKEMALGARKKSKTNIGISTTGVAGPTGGTKEKPVGLVYIGFATDKNVIVKKYSFNGERLENMEKTCKAVFEELNNILDNW